MSTQIEVETYTLVQNKPNSAPVTQRTSSQSPSPATLRTSNQSPSPAAQSISNQLPAASIQHTANQSPAAVATRRTSDQSFKSTTPPTVTLPNSTKKMEAKLDDQT